MSTSERLPYLDTSVPQAWKALNALALKVSAAAESAGLERETLELMNVRISQINACSFASTCTRGWRRRPAPASSVWPATGVA